MEEKAGTGEDSGMGLSLGTQQVNNDMTQGNVFRTLLSFAIPLILTGLLQQMYYIADSVIVGNLLGEGALAAVGVTTPILNVFIFVTTGLVSGYTILLSQYYGAKEYQKISRLSNTFLMFTMIFACVRGHCHRNISGYLVPFPASVYLSGSSILQDHISERPVGLGAFPRKHQAGNTSRGAIQYCFGRFSTPAKHH